MCEMLQIAPSTYYNFKLKQKFPDKRSDREQSDALYRVEIQRVWDANFQVYGARKVWHQLRREGYSVARCTVERLMRSMGLQGAVRGKVKRTTFPSKENRDPFDLVQRNFTATRPNQLWVADFTYVATWAGFVFVAFIIDVFSRMIVGWRASTSMNADLTLDALEQAIWARDISGKLIHHSDRSIAATMEASICPYDIPSVLLRQVSKHPLVASVARMTMRSPRRSMDCTKPRSSGNEVLGKTWKR